jgi:hypothetical protein
MWVNEAHKAKMRKLKNLSLNSSGKSDTVPVTDKKVATSPVQYV